MVFLMIKTDYIKIHNIYYMLAYVFSTLQQHGHQKLQTEIFSNAADLFSAILESGIGNQVRRGLKKGYVSQSAERNRPEGKIIFSESIKHDSMRRGRLSCEYDQFSENIYENQIIKMTAQFLVKSPDVADQRKSALRRKLVYLKAVDDLKSNKICWKMIRTHKNDKSYQLMLNICRLILEGMLMTQSDGSVKLNSYINDKTMYWLFEKFVLAYYRKHYPDFDPKSSYIEWNVADNKDLLPKMQTDITLQYQDQIMIIDTKYYQQSLQTGRFNNQTQHSGNIYQIFSYVKNKDRDHAGKVTGVLLYAKTGYNQEPDQNYQMGKNAIYVRSLDLGREFTEIEAQLKEIAGLLINHSASNFTGLEPD